MMRNSVGVGMVRNYDLTKGRVKDLRSGIESSPEKVLNGDLDAFMRQLLLDSPHFSPYYRGPEGLESLGTAEAS